jgi:imidazolonepropionase-like amidohydrolase
VYKRRGKAMLRTRLRYCLLVTLAVLLAACGVVPGQELRSATLVVTNGMLIDGTGADTIAHGLVAVRGNRILAVGPAADFKIPGEVTVIDAGGGTILPGVINSHAHGVSDASTRRGLFLLDGVTSVCDLGTALSRMAEFEGDESPSGPAARGFKAGPIITAPGGYPGPCGNHEASYEIQGVDQAEAAVSDLCERGADFIKIAIEPGFGSDSWPVMSLDEMRSIVASAHANDRLARAHVTMSSMLDRALQVGVDVVEHMPMQDYSHAQLEAMFDEAGVFQMPPGLEKQMLAMIDQGVALVPTLSVLHDCVYHIGNTDRKTALVSQATLGVLRFFHDSGGMIALGNDYCDPSIDPGMPLREMALLQQAGLSPLAVIEAATQQAAYVCGQGDELGTLEKGKLADLIVVDGNPLEDIGVMDSVVYVVKDGALVSSALQDGR